MPFADTVDSFFNQLLGGCAFVVGDLGTLGFLLGVK
jgi:hypothetical protein